MSVKATIEARKRADAAYRVMDSIVAEDKKILQLAHFELSTGSKIERRIKQVRNILLSWNHDDITSILLYTDFYKQFPLYQLTHL